jgi:hypothetical protein
MAVNVALAAVALRIWNILLFKEYLDRPAVVLAWMGAALLLLLAARELALGTAPEERSRVQRAWAGVRGPELALLLLFVALLFVFHWGFQRAASDGREYFVQLRSLIIDHDLDLANENAAFGVRGTAGNFAFGAPLLWAPFFLLAHVWLGLLNLAGAEWPRNGFFNPYQRAIGLGSLVYGSIALVLIYRLVRQYFSRALASGATIAVALGSFVAWYLVVDNSMSHAVSMFAVTLFIYSWQRTRGEETVGRWALLGALAGLMSLVRWQNVLFVVLPAIEEAGNLAGFALFPVAPMTSTADDDGPSGGKPSSATAPNAASGAGAGLRRTAARYVAFIGAFLLAFSPQFFAWKALRGAWFSPPAGAHGASFGTPPIGDVLFSTDRGLFSWTPLLLLAVIGLLLFARRRPMLGGSLLVALALQVYINATVEWGGHGFGARRFANCALLFALGLAALLQWMKRRPLLGPALIVATLVSGNLFFMAGMQAGDIPATGTVRFRDMVGASTARIGNPFSLPMSALTALRFGTDLGFYERVGAQTFNNLTIDVGGANDERFLVHGWSGAEAGGGITFRWSEGPESTLVVPLKEAADYLLELRGAPFTPPEAEMQVVEISVNDRLVDRVAFTPGMQSHIVDVDGALLRPGFNEIRLRYAWSRSPRAAGLSEDDRELAVQLDSITLTRLQ